MAEGARAVSRFDIVRPIGQGAMGLVYEAVDRESGTRVALKTLRAPTPAALLLLKNESRQLQDLSHPALVTPHELFEHEGEWFFSMDLVEGKDFLSYVRPAGDLDEARLRGALVQLVIGLGALHAGHKVHRDVKPSNVLVELDGRTRILDFGIAFNAETASADEAGLPVGTVSYMAPEQAGGETVTPAADWYAMGAMLYEALTGRPPFEGKIDDVFAQKWSREPAPPRALNPSVPEDLDQLCVDLLRTDPALRPDGSEILERLGAARESEPKLQDRAIGRVVGRRDELARMDEALGDAAEGRAIALLVQGDSGVGKSTLVREFLARARANRGARAFHGRCHERESLPFKAVDSVVDELARYLARLPEAELRAILPEGAAALRTIFPVLEVVPTLDGPIPTQLDELDPLTRRTRLFGLLRQLLESLGSEGPVILVIDDLQWADADSLTLLEEIFRPPDAPPLLLLATIRGASEEPRGGSDVHDRLAHFPGEVRWLPLGPLPDADARALVRELLGRDGSSAGAVDAICAEAHGHPLFIDALVRQRSSGSEGAVARLDDALWERTEKLPADARALLEIVAVAGAPLPQEVVARAALLPFAQLFAPAGTLRSEHFARTSGVYRRDTIEPYHDRVRASVLAHLEDATRRWWHERLAVALEDLGYDDPEKLALHWLGAGDKTRAAENAVLAADRSSKALAFDHAASLYRLALDQRVFSDDALRAIHAKLGDALASSRGSTSPPSSGAGKATSGALVLRARVVEQAVRSGELDKGLAGARDLAAAVDLGLPRVRLAALVRLFFLRTFLWLRGLGYRERDASEVPASTIERLDVCAAIAASLAPIDDVSARLVEARYVVLALRAGEPDHVARALAIETARAARRGARGWPATEKLVARAEALRGPSDRPTATKLAAFTRGFASLAAGRYRDAASSLEQALRSAADDRATFHWELGRAEAGLVTALVWTGRVREARDLQSKYLRDARDRGDVYVAFALRTGCRSFVHLAADDPDAALMEIGEARNDWRGGASAEELEVVLGTASARLYAGEADRALAGIQQHRALLDGVSAFELERTWLRTTRGAAALASAAWGVAEDDARALEGADAAWGRALGLLLRAGIANARDRAPARAAASLREAVRALEDEGLALYAIAARRSLARVEGSDATAIAEADASMDREGIRNPPRMAALLVPGFTLT